MTFCFVAAGAPRSGFSQTRAAAPRFAGAPTYPALPYGTVPRPLPCKNRRGVPRRRQTVNDFCRVALDVWHLNFGNLAVWGKRYVGG